MENMASEIIAEQDKQLKNIIFELDSMIDDLLEKSKFALAELMDLVDEKPENVNDACVFSSNQKRMNMFVNIAFDYLYQAQSALNEIVARGHLKIKRDKTRGRSASLLQW